MKIKKLQDNNSLVVYCCLGEMWSWAVMRISVVMKDFEHCECLFDNGSLANANVVKDLPPSVLSN